MRLFVLVGFLVLLVVVPSPVTRACKVWVPIVTRVQEADLIVAGYVLDSEENKYAVRTYETAGRFDEVDRPYTQRFLHEATVVVTDVLKGTLRDARPETDAAGNRVQSIRVLHDGFIQDSRGSLSNISTDDHIRPSDKGIWLLHRGEIRGTYRRESTLFENYTDEVKRCLDVMQTGYRDWTPGWTPDARTWVATWSTDMRTHARAVVHADGDVTLHGSFRGELFESGRRVLSSSGWEHFIARLDSSGRPRWTRSLGSGQSFDPEPLAGHAGSTLLVGDLHEACSVLGTAMPWNGTRAKSIVSVSARGEIEWAQSLAGQITAISVVPSASGGYRVAGSFKGEIHCAGETILADGESDWFVADLGADGALRRLKRIARDGETRLHRIARGPNDRIVFAAALGRGPQVRCGSRRHDVVVGSMSSDGRVAWTDTLGGEFDDHPVDIAVARGGMVVATVMLTPGERDPLDPNTLGHGMVRPGERFTALCAWSADGKRLWSASGTGSEIEIGADGKIYCLGSRPRVEREIVVSQLPAPMGEADVFIECFDGEGRRLWVESDGGLGAEFPSSLALLPDGRALVAGGFEGLSFLAGRTLRPRGHRDVFVANVALPGR